ncbi:MAG: AAA family ATPase [Gemmataceae bacterium]|nr:AAA family ATPase [Gemmataceae bacterium]MCI0738672.1 AAA family ATPase [Gemmataceae bacterium]
MDQELDYITIKGFRSIKNIEKLSLRPINILVGANGSGKSNFIAAFAFLHAIREGLLQEYVATKGFAESILYFGAKNTKQLQLEVSFDSGSGYHIELSPTVDDRLHPVSEWCWIWNQKTHRQSKTPLPRSNGEAGISKRATKPRIRWVQEQLDSWRNYHFHDTTDHSPIKKNADVDDNRFFRPDGSNIAAYLYLLQKRHESHYEIIRKTIERVAPFFEDFRLAPLRRNESKIKLEWRHKGSDRYFDATSLSDGTLRFVALATLFLQPFEYRPSVILVDEPELGLHPYAIALLASLIKSATKQTQVIVSTQSPLLLDHFDPEDVLVADRTNGETTLTRLQSADLEHWLADYSLGQLWEKNQFGGRPGRG